MRKRIIVGFLSLLAGTVPGMSRDGDDQTADQIAVLGFIEIQTTPAGAELSINDQLVGVTPYKGTHPSGLLTLHLQKTHHEPQKLTIFLAPQEHLSLSLILKEKVDDRKINYGAIRINSDPPEAEIWIDGRHKGVTPYRDPKLPEGEYHILLRKAYHFDLERTIAVERGKLHQETFTLVPTCSKVEIRSPRSTEIWIDDRYVGSDTVQIRLDAGEHVFTVRADKHNPVSRTLTLNRGESRILTLAPEPRIGIVSVSAAPVKGQPAEIVLNGEFKGFAPQTLRLLEGAYHLQVRKPDFLTDWRTIDVVAQQEQEIRVQLAAYAGSLKATKDRWGRRRNRSLGAAAAFLGAGGFCKVLADQRYDQYRQAPTVGQANSYRTQVENYDTASLVFFAAAGTSALLSLYSHICWAQTDVPGERIAVQIDPKNRAIGLALNF
ncbi:PEGA domain-containing protein [candidate division KSB1 bacterium]|nr:PEGA domain-containing protein [candidate division KSB1 bacterium]